MTHRTDCILYLVGRGWDERGVGVCAHLLSSIDCPIPSTHMINIHLTVVKEVDNEFHGKGRV